MSDPPSLPTSPFYGYQNGYSQTDSIFPGKGYWVRSSAEGKIILEKSPGSSVQGIMILKVNEQPPAPPFEEAKNSAGLPNNYELFQNYPNPFKPTTRIKYAIPRDSRVVLKIYNTLGQEISTLVDAVQTAGYKSVDFEINELPAGVYFCRMSAEGFTNVRKLLVIK
jgi:hypothetical protein